MMCECGRAEAEGSQQPAQQPWQAGEYPIVLPERPPGEHNWRRGRGLWRPPGREGITEGNPPDSEIGKWGPRVTDSSSGQQETHCTVKGDKRLAVFSPQNQLQRSLGYLPGTPERQSPSQEVENPFLQKPAQVRCPT